MHRKSLIRQIQDYAVKYPREADVAEQFISFIQKNKDCFQRTLAEGHITGSAWLFDLRLERILLTHHRKLNKWLQLGGHADGMADILQVAWREAREESGISDLVPLSTEIFDIAVHKIPEYSGVPEHLHYDINFLFRVENSEEYRVSQESNDLAWVHVGELLSYSDCTSMRRMISKWYSLKDTI